MTDAIKPDVETAGLFTEQEIRTFSFDIRQSALLHKFAEELAARNQILLKLVDNSALAYDMDNEGKLVRLVANFKGGGLTKIPAEPDIKGLSSHSSLALGPHTVAPYWCAANVKDGHSP